ncbi:sugar transferase [Neglectibacter caecimuris]|uniref:sugar transferase n=1 Tax=Neglectibacter caecimuris TaxID=3093658 RepID=UPI002AC8AE2A|nr:sugar transferase [Neglectibacter sp. M00184]
MRTIKKLKRTIVFILKLALFVSLFGIFFGIFGINNPWLFNLNRTTGVTMLTFAVLGIALMSVYGGYAIGTQKSKPIVYSMSLAAIITDLVTHLQLSIMNTSEKNNPYFVYETPHLLLLVIVLQVLVIIFFAYFGNFVYFSLEPPEKCCVISSSRQSLGNIIPKINKFKKQYEVDEIIRFDAPDVLDVIARNDTVFLYDVPVRERIVLTEYCYQKQKNIYYNFEMSDVVSQGAKYMTLDDKSLVMHVAKDLTMEQRIVKRLMDLGVSLIALILTSPIMLGCALAIKLEDGGKVFYKQKRLTKYGRVFEVYKFRTMKEENSIHKSVTADDDRITKVGKLLRKYRIDELPQMLNILKGDMTVVGPRPEMLENVEKYTGELPEFSYRLRMKAGLTGLAQISGKYNTSPKDKLVMDLMYIENYSIWQDLKLIFQTITVFFKASESTEAFGAEELYDFDEDREKNRRSRNSRKKRQEATDTEKEPAAPEKPEEAETGSEKEGD